MSIYSTLFGLEESRELQRKSSNYVPREQPRDLRIIAHWQDDESPLGCLFGWRREVDIYGNYVDRNERNDGDGDGENDESEDKAYSMDNSFLFGFILGIGMGLMIADFQSIKQSLSLRGAL